MPVDYQSGDNALAVRSGGEWILKPVCGGSGFANGFAAREGGDWVLLAAGPVRGNENAVAVRTAPGDTVLLPIGCPEEEEGCTGNDPLCSACPCDAGLESSYVVTLSGFPSLYTLNTFNGAWTVTWSEDCVWICDITAYHRVTLSCSAAGLWRVAWSVNSPGGASGDFTGSGGTACDPAGYDWSYNSCTEPYPLLWPVCPTVQSSVSVGVA